MNNHTITAISPRAAFLAAETALAAAVATHEATISAHFAAIDHGCPDTVLDFTEAACTAAAANVMRCAQTVNQAQHMLDAHIRAATAHI